MDVEESPLERLIAKSTSEQAAQSTPFLLEESLSYVPVSHTPPAVTMAQTIRSSLATLGAGSLCLLQTGLVWGSFLSSSWFDTHLIISIDWQKQYFPFLNDAVDQLLHSTTLASLLSTFMGAEQHVASLVLIISSILIPCLCMILCPVWTVSDHKARLTTRQQQPQPQPQQTNSAQTPRIIFESLLRFSLLAYFLLALLDVGTSSIEIVSNDTKFSITNQTRGGLVAYALGMSCALGVIVILRSTRRRVTEYIPAPVSSEENYRPSLPRPPPNQAFQLPWHLSANENSQEQQRPLLADDDEFQGQVETMQIQQGGLESQDISFCKKAVLFEFGIVATLFWLPALFLPLFQLNYGGLVSDFMAEVSFSIKLWELPAVLWQRGIAAGTPKWMLLSLGLVLIMFVYILPMLATILSICTWRMKSTAGTFCRSTLHTIHPCLVGIVFALALLFAIPSFEPIGEYLLDEGTSGLCKKFHIVTNDTCLTISGKPDLGLWFLIGQSIVLEIFVILTLCWKKIH